MSGIQEEIVDENSHEENWLQILKFVNRLVVNATGKELSEPQALVLKCAWYRREYKDIRSPKYSELYLRNSVGPELWGLLSTIFNKKMVKRDIRPFLEQVDLNISYKLTKNLAILGGELPDMNNFYGRKKDVTKLEQEVICQRFVILIGDTGIGKSTLAARLLLNISQNSVRYFNTLVWKSIVHPISVEDLITDFFEILSLESNPKFNSYQRASYLINQLRKKKTLIVLDGFECIIQDVKYQEEYIRFFRRLIEEGNGASFLITSRVAFKQLEDLSNKRLVKHIQAFGLNVEESIKFLENKGVKNFELAEELIDSYRGNPTALEELAEEITRYFGGDLQKYFKYKTTMVGERLLTTLHNFFGRSGEISPLQRSMMIFLAEELSSENSIENSIKSIKITTILDYFKTEKFSNRDIFSALKGLEGKLLIEPIENEAYEICYSLQPGIKKYILNDPLGFVRKSSES